jgi:hypothetical protein
MRHADEGPLTDAERFAMGAFAAPPWALQREAEVVAQRALASCAVLEDFTGNRLALELDLEDVRREVEEAVREALQVAVQDGRWLAEHAGTAAAALDDAARLCEAEGEALLSFEAYSVIGRASLSVRDVARAVA